MNGKILENLNSSQREAVLYNEGASLVIAGAGSGKTRVLTCKIAYLLQSGYDAYSILALTFTNKAAREMKERIASMVGGQTASRLWMGTFHSIFSRILRQNAEVLGFTSNFTIYDSADSRSLIKSIIKEMSLDDKVYKAASVQAAISNAKNALITPRAYAANGQLLEADKSAKRPLICEIYKTYWSRCFLAGAMDFDDLLLYTNILFRDHPEVLERYRNIFRFILVDEYQDTNFAQHLIVNQLAKVHQNICVVGDDAQSIYSFRGANISNILNLTQEYPACRTFKLERNYRSTQNIVNAANSLISKNKEQIQKKVYSENSEGEKLALMSAYSDFEEGYLVANKLAQLRMYTGSSYNDFAILYRTNAQSRILEEALRKRNIPYRIYGGLSFYQRKEIKDIIAYFRLATNPHDEEALKRVINYPKRGIGDTTLAHIHSCAAQHVTSPWQVVADPITYALPVRGGTLTRIQEFAALIKGFGELATTLDAAEVAEAIVKQSGVYTDLFADRSAENLSKQENVYELLNGIREFSSLRLEEGIEQTTLVDFLADVSLATDQDTQTDDENAEKVTLMTVHASKGLEFDHVFVVGLEEDLFPSAMSKGSIYEMEEERRLLYVAITRAGISCTLTYAASRYRNGKSMAMPPSRFIKDIDSRYINKPASLDEPTQERTERPTYGTNPFFRKESRSNYEDSFASTSTHASEHHRKLTPLQQRVDSPSAPTTQSVGDLNVGARIEHNRFGIGTVAEISGEDDNCKIAVEFDNVGRKQLLLKFAKFTRIED